MKRMVVLLTVVALMMVMVTVSVSPAFAQPPFQVHPKDCANGVAQTFGSDPDHNAADALEAFCDLPINRETGKGR